MLRFALFCAIAVLPLSASAQFDIEREPINDLKSPSYRHLSNDDRQAILEILRDTKPDWEMFMSRRALAPVVGVTGR